jgi:oxaloacetate decarboxylase gamma subunit
MEVTWPVDRLLPNSLKNKNSFIFSLFRDQVLWIMARLFQNVYLVAGRYMAELMNSGVELMLVGMGIVYVFLTVLVIAIGVMSSLMQRFFPESPAVSKKSIETDKSTIAAISAAVHHYRSKN